MATQTTSGGSRSDWTRSGWATLAMVVMFAVGFSRVISAIGYFADSSRINNLANGALHNHLWFYGLWDLIVAALALYAGYSLSKGGGFGRVIAYIWAVVIIMQSFMIFSWAPWYAAASITLAVLVTYGLAKSPIPGSDSYSP